MTPRPNSRRYALKLVALCGLLALFALTSAASLAHFHRDADSTAHCVICHMSHSRAVRPAPRVALSAPSSGVDAFRPEPVALYPALKLRRANPRAPPA